MSTMSETRAADHAVLPNGTPPGRRNLDKTADVHHLVLEFLLAADETRLRDAVCEVLFECSDAVRGATRWQDPLEVPTWVHRIRRAIANHVVPVELPQGGER